MADARSVTAGFQISDFNRAQIADLFRWCIADPTGRHDPGRGLWLWGSIGSGKSTLLEIVRRFCGRLPWRRTADSRGYRSPYSFRTSNAVAVCAEFQQRGFAGIETFIDSPRQAFDELGSETIPTGYYGTSENVFQYVLQRRYDNRYDSFTHVTTNLSEHQIGSAYGARIYDRCKEMFNFVEISGPSYRRKFRI